MRKLRTIAAVLLIGMATAGCNLQTIADYVATGVNFIASIQDDLAATKAYINTACNGLYRRQLESTPNCAVKISKLRAGVDAICRNTALITNDVVGDYVLKVEKAVANSQTGGC